MPLRTVLVINALIALIFAIGFLAAPAQLLNAYGVVLPAGGILLARLFGAALVQIGLLAWGARRLPDAATLRVIALAYFVGSAVGLVCMVLGQLAGVVNSLGWLSVAIYVFLTAGYGYTQFKKPGVA